MNSKPAINMAETLSNIRQIRIEDGLNSYVKHIFDTYEMRPHQKTIIEDLVKKTRKNLITSFPVVELDPMPLIRAMSGK